MAMRLGNRFSVSLVLWVCLGVHSGFMSTRCLKFGLLCWSGTGLCIYLCYCFIAYCSLRYE